MIGITIGDPAGVGPEVALKAVAEMSAADRARTVIFGDRGTLRRAVQDLGIPLRPGEDVAVHDIPVQGGPLPWGQVDARGGDAAVRAVEAAVRAAERGEIGCIVTAPLHKEAMNLAGHHHDGHTGLLSTLTGQKAFMLLASERLKVIHCTTHVSLRDAIDRITPQRVLETVRAGHHHLRRVGYEAPRIAVAALNPHAGEGGLFGTEDHDRIAPAVEAARAEGIDAQGPISADTLFHRAYHGAFDLIVANYHDQGHIPVKLVAFDTGVNVSVGLSIDRTSVDHGTAFDIAGRGVAKHENMTHAIAYARRLAADRERRKAERSA